MAWVREHITGDEKGEAQIFLDHLFQGFGHKGVKEAGATLEQRIKKEDAKGTAFADLVWKPVVLIEMKKRGVDLSKHYRQAFDYWVRLVPGRPRYVVLCNFDEFWVSDFETQMDSPVDTVTLDEIPRREGPLAFLFPTPEKPVFKNDHEAVTRDAADRLATCFNKLVTRRVARARSGLRQRQRQLPIHRLSRNKAARNADIRADERAFHTQGRAAADRLRHRKPVLRHRHQPARYRTGQGDDDDRPQARLWFVTKCGKLKSDFRYSAESVYDTFPWPQSPGVDQINAVAGAGREVRRVRGEALEKIKGGLRAVYRTLELPGKNPLKDAHAALDAAVLAACGFSPKSDLLAQLLALNLEVAARIDAGERVTAPGVPATYPDPSQLITDDCIRPT